MAFFTRFVRGYDTAIAAKYQADKSRVVSFNDLELGGLATGRTIVIPGGVLPTNERPGYVAPRSSRGSFGGGTQTSMLKLPALRPVTGMPLVTVRTMPMSVACSLAVR